MKLTKSQLKQIIKEELESVLGIEQDTELADELFPEESMSEAVGVGTIALGTALGILGVYAVGKVGKYAMNILRTAGAAVLDKAKQKALEKKNELREEQWNQMVQHLSADTALTALVADYYRLVTAVESAKGQRGPEFQQLRAKRKEVAAQLSAAVNAAVTAAWEHAHGGKDLDPLGKKFDPRYKAIRKVARGI